MNGDIDMRGFNVKYDGREYSCISMAIIKRERDSRFLEIMVIDSMGKFDILRDFDKEFTFRRDLMEEEE